MRSTLLGKSWELWTIMLICLLALLPAHADQTGQDGIKLCLYNVSFQKLVSNLASENGMKLVIKTDLDPLVNADFPTATPVEMVIKTLSQSVGLSLTKVGDTYYITQAKVIEATPPTPVIDTPPAAVRDTWTNPTPKPATLTQAPVAPAATTPPAKPVVRKIELQFMNCRELMYMINGGVDPSIEISRRRVLNQRIDTLFSTRQPQQVTVEPNSSASDSLTAGNSPWLTGVYGNLSRQNSATDAFQIGAYPFPSPFPGPTTTPGGIGTPTTPTYPTPGGFPTTPTTTPTPGTTPGNPNAPGANNAAGGLKQFIPEGVEAIIGITSLNSVLVRAKSEDDIDQLASLIKLLDQPVQQVMIETMFVDMRVKDAEELGASLQYSGMPLSMLSQNGGNTGNFSLQYMKGNIRAALSSLLSKSWNKVINAPRLIVQNNQVQGTVIFDTTVPFITTNQTQDVFGRTLTDTAISAQDFQEGMTVNNVVIHPDNTVTMQLTPILTIPTTTSVPVPGGGSGNVFGTTNVTIQTLIRLKSGETAMMGGFVSDNEVTAGTRSPLLSNIPVIGPLLFTYRQHSTDNSETMIFVTATIMAEDKTDFGGMATLPPLF